MTEENRDRKIIHTLPTKLPTEFEHEKNLPKTEVNMYNSGPVDDRPGHIAARPGANFDEKIYMFPDSYNYLRTELNDNWPKLFAHVGYAMAFDAVRFIELMDDALDTKTGFDSAKVDAICKKYIDLLRNKRGLSSLHTTGEKA